MISKNTSNNMDTGKSKPLSTKIDKDEARLKLAENLDKELESFISSLEKRSKSEAWPEDKWQEEMEKHPFFMTKIPESGELPPLLQGLQELKYSTEENSPEDLAKAYKDDGNFHYKLKKYRTAIMCYTEGIKQNCNDVELNGQLYNNRAAAHYFLGNFRSCYNDCKCALRALPVYPKALKRLAQACFELGLYKECIKTCKILDIEASENAEIKDLMKSACKKNRKKESDERKNIKFEKKASKEKIGVHEAIKKRGINFVPNDKNDFNPLEKQVHLVDNRLVWPVLILYPEYETSDIIENFHEDHSFLDELTEIFSDYADWDINKKYTLQTISMYYENVRRIIKSVNLSTSLGDILSNNDFRIENGLPTFLVFAKGSEAERKFLEHYK